MCLKESCFQDCWRVSLGVLVFKNVGERPTAKNYHLLLFFLWLAKSLKNLEIICLLIIWGNVVLRFDNLWFLTVLISRIARTFNRPWATRAVACGISKTLDRVWHAGHLHESISLIIFLIGIHSMQGSTATMSYGFRRKRSIKR